MADLDALIRYEIDGLFVEKQVGYGLYDPTTGDRLPVGLTQHGKSTMPSEQSAVSRADLESAVADVTAGAEPQLADTILADAHYLPWHQKGPPSAPWAGRVPDEVVLVVRRFGLTAD